MKVLTGIYKGRNLACAAGVRPVSAMVRKACFDILTGEVQGKRVLDICAGTGALGFEALSCGAAHAVFCDTNASCVSNIEKVITALSLADTARVYLKNAYAAAADFGRLQRQFDLIFIDPPYYQGMAKNILQAIHEYGILAPRGYALCFLYARDEVWAECPRPIVFQKCYGQTRLLIYE